MHLKLLSVYKKFPSCYNFCLVFLQKWKCKRYCDLKKKTFVVKKKARHKLCHNNVTVNSSCKDRQPTSAGVESEQGASSECCQCEKGCEGGLQKKLNNSEFC